MVARTVRYTLASSSARRLTNAFRCLSSSFPADLAWDKFIGHDKNGGRAVTFQEKSAENCTSWRFCRRTAWKRETYANNKTVGALRGESAGHAGARLRRPQRRQDQHLRHLHQRHRRSHRRADGGERYGPGLVGV